jgi:hypothetical protein
VPKPAVSNRSKTVALFDHLVGAQEDRGWQFHTDRSSRLEIDDQFEVRDLLDRKIGRFCPVENLGD